MATFSMTAMRGALPSCSYRSAAAPRPAQAVVMTPQCFSGFVRENRLGLSTGASGACSNILSLAANGSKWFAMRHGNRLKKLALPADQRKALIRSLVTETLRHGKITTTKVRAKAIRKYVDKMIGLAKDGSLHARRQALGFVFDKEIVRTLFLEAPVRYGDRSGGYCRVVTEIRTRRGDNAEMAIIELV